MSPPEKMRAVIFKGDYQVSELKSYDKYHNAS